MEVVAICLAKDVFSIQTARRDSGEGLKMESRRSVQPGVCSNTNTGHNKLKNVWSRVCPSCKITIKCVYKIILMSNDFKNHVCAYQPKSRSS